MGWTRVENNQVTQIGLPQTGYLKDGSSVSGYNLLDEQVLLNEGWLPLEDNKPSYNPMYEDLIFDGYIILSDKVTTQYKVIEKQIIDEFIDEEKIAMAEAIIDLEHRISILEGGK